MTDPAPAAQAVVPPKRRSTLLIVSLCLNVALLAMIAAGIINAVWHKPPPPGGPLMPRALMRDATDDEQDRIQAIMEQHAVRVGQMRRAAAEARKNVLTVFATPNFSQAALESALAKMRAADMALQTEVATIIAESAAQLTPQERARIADRARKQTTPWWRRPLARAP